LHHPHIHCVATGGGISLDGTRWISTKPGFFLPVRALSRLFRRLFLEALEDAFRENLLCFPGKIEALKEPAAFFALTSSLRQKEWVVYSKPPFGGPQRVLEYLGRYTHRVAIDNRRILKCLNLRSRGKETFDGNPQKFPATPFPRPLLCDPGPNVVRCSLRLPGAGPEIRFRRLLPRPSSVPMRPGEPMQNT